MIGKEEKIVVNTSPWIALSICSQIPFIMKMLENGIWIKDEIVKGVLEAAKEEL
jgi:hypothetical protein